mgnify:CR=1 FL=1
MSWTTLMKEPRGRPWTGIRVAIRKSAGSKALHLAVMLGPDVIERVGWNIGDLIRPRAGFAEHAGLLRLEKCDSDDGFTLQKQRHKTQARPFLRLPLWYGLPDKPARVQLCTFEILDGGVVQVRLPQDWMTPRDAGAHPPIVRPAAKRPTPVETPTDPRWAAAMGGQRFDDHPRATRG